MATPSFFRIFDQKIEALLKKSQRPKIAFGLQEPSQSILESLRRAQKYADIVLVGPEAIRGVEGFHIVTNTHPEERLASMLAHDEVRGIVRGTIDDFKTYEAYQRISGDKETINPGLLQDPMGRQFFVSPLSNPEGWRKEERLFIARHLAQFVREWGIEPNIAIFTGERDDTYPRRKHITEGVVGVLNRTYEDAEWIVSALQKEGWQTKNWAIDLNPAVEAGANILIPVNGMVGNQIFRVVLFCGGKVLAAPRLGLKRCYEDNSRTERDFEYHVKFLVAQIQSKRA